MQGDAADAGGVAGRRGGQGGFPAPQEIVSGCRTTIGQTTLAEMLDKPIDDVKRMLGLNERVTSVDVPIIKDTEKSLLDAIPDEQNVDPASLLQDDDIRINIESWLNQLNDKQREVVERRFGLNSRDVSTLEEVGNELGVTRERVRQIQMEALKRLREIMERDGYSVDLLFK